MRVMLICSHKVGYTVFMKKEGKNERIITDLKGISGRYLEGL